MIKIGDLVHWQYFNTPERKFYGPVRQGEIVDIVKWDMSTQAWHSQRYNEIIPDFHPVVSEAYQGDTRYIVQWDTHHNLHLSTLQRKEIKRILKG